MEFNNSEAELYIPDKCPNGLLRTTDLCVAAHQDDVEIMAYSAVAECYRSKERFFSAVVVTDGAGSPREGKYAGCTDEEMKKIRINEQKKAADTGKYAALALLGFESGSVKNGENKKTVDEISKLVLEARPQYIYTHNFADKHDTHVATALRTVDALRKIKDIYRPVKVYMLEVWRSLDWLCDCDKILFDTSLYPQLSKSLLEVYESQIAGGKRYDAAAIGRRKANATFFESHRTDGYSSLSYGLDATEFVYSDMLPFDFISGNIRRFETEVEDRLKRLGQESIT